jgi:hypothetical protein
MLTNGNTPSFEHAPHDKGNLSGFSALTLTPVAAVGSRICLFARNTFRSHVLSIHATGAAN